MGWDLRGALRADGDGVDFAGCRVQASFARVASTRSPRRRRADVPAEEGEPSAGDQPSDGVEEVRSRAVGLVGSDGSFTILLPDPPELVGGLVVLRAFSASGAELGAERLSQDRLGTTDTVTVGVRRPQATTVPRRTEAAAEEPSRRVVGRVLERQGRSLPCGQVLLLAAERAADDDAEGGEPTPKEPILAAALDKSGYFTGVVPTRSFLSVVAVVAGAAAPVPIRLEGSRVPSRIPILVDAAPTDDSPGTREGGTPRTEGTDCGCGCGGRLPRSAGSMYDPTDEPCGECQGPCPKFTISNCAVEEFSFYSLVRTTEPEISGVVPDELSDPPVVLPPPPEPPVAAETTLETALRLALYPKLPVATGVAGVDSAIVIVFWVTHLPIEAHQVLTDAGDSSLSIQALMQLVVDEVRKAGFVQPGTTNIQPPTAQPASLTLLNTVIHAIVTASAGGDALVSPRSAAVTVARPQVAELVPSSDLYPSRGLGPRAPGRLPLTGESPVDWDTTPTVYEATTIAHGHLLQFKQSWYADGFSLGDLLYSLPLAPGQKKLVAVLDWERRETTSREEFTTADESLRAMLARDRDVGEVISGALSETIRGGSRNTTSGWGVGTGAAGNGSYQGFNFGALLGVSGGVGESQTTAFQDSAREVAGSSMQTLRDNTLQSASAVRSLRTSVVQTARQGEAVSASTEVVANHNHCHALTIQYFEVLRHFLVSNALVSVQECLFVPLPISGFNRLKVLRWRQSLLPYLKRRELEAGFDATRRVATNWEHDDTPTARYADELVTAVFGELTVTLLIPLPPIPSKPVAPPPDPTAAAEQLHEALLPTEGFLGLVTSIATLGLNHVVKRTGQATSNLVKSATEGAKSLARSLYELSPEEQYERFQHDVMPSAAAGFVDALEVYALSNGREIRLDGADFTLVSEYQPGVPLLVSLRGTIRTPVPRSAISSLIVKAGVPLPTGCRAIINTASLSYQTRTFRHPLVSDSRANDDIDLTTASYTGPSPSGPPGPPGLLGTLPWLFGAFVSTGPGGTSPFPGMSLVRVGAGATLYTPLDEWEQRRPRLEDIRLSAELVEHLNANLEFYHHAIWWTMDPNRRYLLLDGYEAPNSGGRSVASVVANTLIGIVGNSLILPVAPGNHLDPRFAEEEGADLLELYAPQSPTPPARVSLPTRGVFAEASLGECNACEEIDDTRFWRWDEAPIDEPPALDLGALASRRAEPSVAPTPFPAPVTGFQRPDSVPDPAGVVAALTALANASFRDIAGVEGTQANAAAAYAKAMDSAVAFGREASMLAQAASAQKNIGQTMRQIDGAEAGGKIDAEQARALRGEALGTLVGGPSTDPKAAAVADRLKVLDDQAARGAITGPDAAARRAEVLKGLESEDAVDVQAGMAATELIRRIPGSAVSGVEIGETVVRAAGDATGESPSTTADRQEREFAAAYPGLFARLDADPWEAKRQPSFCLWNFGVGTADLKRFAAVLRNFGGDFALLRDRGYSADIVGSASVSGGTARNADLAFARALAVASHFEREFSMPDARINIRQVGARLSPPPGDVIAEFGDTEPVRRAWNRRVEVHPIPVEPWTDTVYDRIIAVLTGTAAPVADEEERTRAKLLAALLKDGQTDDLAIMDFQSLLASVRYFWDRDSLYNRLLLDPGQWDKFPFARHLREELATAATPAADDSRLATALVSLLRALVAQWRALNQYVQWQQQGGSGDAIHVVLQRAYRWAAEQAKDEQSVYSVLVAP